MEKIQHIPVQWEGGKSKVRPVRMEAGGGGQRGYREALAGGCALCCQKQPLLQLSPQRNEGLSVLFIYKNTGRIPAILTGRHFFFFVITFGLIYLFIYLLIYLFLAMVCGLPNLSVRDEFLRLQCFYEISASVWFLLDFCLTGCP